MNRRFKLQNFLAAALAVAMLCAIVPVSAAAAEFPDIVSSGYGWALDDINNVTENGLYKGFDDGTFRPGEMITVEQAIAVCVRVCGYSDDVRAAVLKQYADALDDIFGTDRSWYREEFAVAVEAGLVTIEGLAELYDSGKLMKSLTREEFTRYLAVALQMLPPSSGFELTFGDKATIDTKYARYVYLLSSIGIIVGDLEGNFNPKNEIRRADSATMFSRAIRYMDANGLAPELDGYTDYTVIAGTIDAVTRSTDGSVALTLGDYRGDTASVVIPAAAKIYEHNIYTSRDALNEGRYARVLSGKDGKIYAVRLYAAPVRYEGVIVELNDASITIDTDTAKRVFGIDRHTRVLSASVRLDGSMAWDDVDLSSGYDRAECTVDETGALATVYLLGGTRSESALFQKYESGVVTVLGFDGAKYELKLAAGVSFTASGTAVTTGSLSTHTGRLVILTIDNYTGEVLAAAIDTLTEYVQGGLAVVRTYTSSNSTVHIVNPDTNRETSYTVINGVKAYFGGELTAISALKAGDFVTLRLEGGRAAEIYSSAGSKTIEGELTNIAYGTVITMEITRADGVVETLEMDAKNLPPVTRTGRSSSIDKLQLRDAITVTVLYNRVKKIDAAAPTADLEAKVTSISIDANGSRITLELDDGTTEILYVAVGASITRDGKTTALSSLTPGTRVAVVISGTSVTALEVLQTPGTSGELSGTVLFINTNDRTILLETADGNLTISYPITAKLMNTKGEALGVSALEIGDIVQIHGEYGTDGLFTATLIIKK